MIAVAIVLSVPARSETHALVVAGFGGDADYDQVFNEQAQAIADAIAAHGTTSLLAASEATRTSLQSAIEDLAAQTGAGDTAIVVMLGHGSFDSRDYRFHVRGPDPTGDDLTRWLAGLDAEHQLIVVATSASGAIFEALQDPEEGSRIVFTATKNGQEQIATVFGRYFAEGLTRTDADTDKNGSISADEAYAYVERALEDHFDADRRLASEHARRTDAEASIRLARVATATTYDVETRSRLETLEDEVVALRAKRSTLPPGEYLEALQALLIEIAMLEAEAEADAGAER